MSSPPRRIYCVDTNIFINLTAYYPERIFPTLWANIDLLVGSERFLVPEQVVRENKHEPTARWLTERAHIIRPFDAACNRCLLEIMAALPNFVDTAKIGDDADQFLVALAMAENQRLHGSPHGSASVLSNERSRRAGEPRLRVPDACRHFGIDCYTLFRLMEIEDWRF
jgi:hypothetical protein